MLSGKGVIGASLCGVGSGDEQRLLLWLGRIQRRTGGTRKATFQEFEFPF
jgi:hypothetical protein